MILYKSDITNVSSVDEVGNVFFWQRRVFRAINDSYAAEVKKLLSCGLMDELIRNNLFPKTIITADISLEGFNLILEHEKIPCITAPSQWSFNMLKDICLAYLAIFKICGKYGYTLKDGHLWNLTFFDNHPVFFDLGSIVRGDGREGLFGLYISALMPLQIWSKGDFYLANLILRDDYSHSRFLPSTSLADHAMLQPIVPFFETYPFRFIRKAINYIARKFLKKNIVPVSSLSSEQLARIINKTEKKVVKTTWSGYHDDAFNGINIVSNPRFDRIIEVLNGLDLGSMIDLAGNKGNFSLLVAQRTRISHIFCTDYDESAVDGLYMFIKNTSIKKVSPVLLNFLCPILGSSDQELKADIAVALAVTHHLLLTQAFPIDKIFRRIGAYSNRFVLVEFMPLGLWDGKRTSPIPDWYTVEWFRSEFKKQFGLLAEEKTEENRVFFLGEKRKDVKGANE